MKRTFALALVLAAAVAYGPEFGLPYPDWWREPSPPRPSAGPRFDPAAFERWAEAQPKEVAPIVAFLRKHLRHVDQREFEASLATAFETFQKNHTSGKKLLFITIADMGGEAKSNAWVTALLREKFPRAFKDAAFLNLSGAMPRRQDLQKLKELVDSGEYRVVVADDGIYTGRQLADQVLGNVATLVDGLDVIVPFATTEAVERFEKGVKKAYGIPFKIHRAQTIPSFAEIWETMPEGERRALETLGVRRIFSESHTLTTFDHKLPDFVSFPRWIAEGFSLVKAAYGSYVPLDATEMVRQGRAGQPTPQHLFFRSGGEPYKCRQELGDVPG